MKPGAWSRPISAAMACLPKALFCAPPAAGWSRTSRPRTRPCADAFAGAEGGDAGLGTQGIAVPLVGNDGQRYLAHILPLTSGARRKAGVGYAAVAAVFVRKVQLETPAAPEVMAKSYGLTPSELRVLLAVFESGSVADIADTLGIAEATAKTHLHRLFAKTRTKRQADLVKLVAGFIEPGR